MVLSVRLRAVAATGRAGAPIALSLTRLDSTLGEIAAADWARLVVDAEKVDMQASAMVIGSEPQS